MIRRHKKHAFWIVFFSLNLIPWVAQGKGATQGEEFQVGDVIYEEGGCAWVKTKGFGKAVPPSCGAWASKNEKKIGAKIRAGKQSTPPAAPPPKGEAKDLSLSDLQSSVRSFEAHFDFSSSGKSVELLGRVFKDCEPLVQIEQVTDAPGCSGQIGFRVKDRGGFVECMKGHSEPCTDGACQDFDSLAKASFNLTHMKTAEITIVRSNPDGNKKNRNVCESFPTKLIHKSFDDIQAEKTADEERKRREDQALAEAQVKNCVGSEDDLEIAREACGTLAALGLFNSEEECRKVHRLDAMGLNIIANQIKQGPVDGLEDATKRLLSWVEDHPKDCDKAVSLYQIAANRLVKQPIRRSRYNDVDPMTGYRTSQDLFAEALEETCFAENAKFVDMAHNLNANATKRTCELGGLYSQECQISYEEHWNASWEYYNYSCTGWEMDPSCRMAQGALRTTTQIPQYVSMTEMKKYQMQMALQQTLMQSGGGMAGMMNPMAGGMPGMMGPSFGGMPNFGFSGGQSSQYGFGI